MAEPTQASVSKVDRVIEHVLGMVNDGSLKPGDRLPSERFLADDLKMSRTVVREAMSALQLSGTIDRRAGDGSYLNVSAEELSDVSGPRLPTGMSLVDALELRMALEVASVALACTRARPSDLLRMEATVTAMKEFLQDEDYEGYLDASMDLHLAIGRAAHSHPLQISQAEITEKARCDQWLLVEQYTPEIASRSLQEHSAIVRALRKRDMEAAVHAVERHYLEYPTITESGESDEVQAGR